MKSTALFCKTPIEKVQIAYSASTQPSSVSTYSDITWEIIEEAFEHSSSYSQGIDSKQSLSDFFLQKLEEKVPNTKANYANERKRRIIKQMSKTWGTYIGSSADRQSLKFLWLEECLEEGVWRKTVVKNESLVDSH